MTIQEAIKKRHMVRQYTDKPIPANIVELLNERITENNKNTETSKFTLIEIGLNQP